MKRLQEKVLKPIIVISLIFVLAMADFIVLGMQVISYAIGIIEETNAENVLFAAYFLDDEGNKEQQLEKNITDENIKLCLEVQVNNEGYFNGRIQINDSNFKLKENIENEYINNISENVINLNQINAGNYIVLELDIVPIKNTVYDLGLLNKKSNIQIIGTYVTSLKKDKEIDSVRELQLVLKSPYSGNKEDNELEVNSEIVTNKVYEVDGKKNRLVQVQIDSGLVGNRYPIKSTKIKMDVLNGVQDIIVEKRGTYATNNDKNDILSNWNKAENKFEIELLNQEVDGRVQWNHNKRDSILVTYILDERESIKGKEIGIDIQVQLYDNENTTFVENSKVIGKEEIDGVVLYQISNFSELYKGNLYYREETFTESKSIIDIRYKNIADIITVEEGKSTYLGDRLELEANFEYRLTKINKEDIIRILGNNGKLEIKTLEGNVIANITKEMAEQNEGENIELSYDAQENIVIQIINPENEGKLALIHQRVLKEDVYKKEQIKSIENLKVQGKVYGNKNFESKDEESIIQLKEPETYATIRSNTNVLSSVQTNENIEFNVILKTDDIKYNLYKNPIIEIEFPSEIKDIQPKLNPIFIDEFEIKVAKIFENKNGNKVIRLELDGEQTKHSNSITEGIIININASIDVEKFAPSKDITINLRYINENEENKVFEEKLLISLQSKDGLLVYNKMENYNKNGNVIETVESGNLSERLDIDSEEKVVKAKTILTNNYDKELNNVVIVEDNLSESTFDLLLLNSISVLGADAKIYYSENSIDWVENINDLQDVKSYKIEIDKIDSLGLVEIDYNLKIPANLTYNQVAIINQDVMYLYENQNISKNLKIQLQTESTRMQVRNMAKAYVNDITGNLEIDTKTLLANKELSNQDSVYEGETLTNVITISNKTGRDLSNVKVCVNQENAVIYDLVGEERVNLDISQEIVIEHLYNEWETGEKIFDIIETLKSGEIVNLQYEVVVNKVNSDDKVTLGNIKIQSDNFQEISTNTIQNKIVQADVKVNTKCLFTEEVDIYTNDILTEQIHIKNIKGQDLKNLTGEIQLSEGLYIDNVQSINFYDKNKQKTTDNIENIQYDNENNKVTFNIKELLANDEIYVLINPIVKEITLTQDKAYVQVYSKVINQNGEIYSSNIAQREILQRLNDIVVEQSTDVQNEQILRDEDNFNINFVIENRSNRDTGLYITDRIHEGFVVNSAKLIKGTEEIDIKDKISDINVLFMIENIDAKSSIEIQLNFSVDTSVIPDDEKQITNIIEVVNNYNTLYSNELIFNIEEQAEEIDPDDVEDPADPDDVEDPEDPEEPSQVEEPTAPEDPDNPETPEDPNNPNKPNIPGIPNEPEESTFVISGVVWIDKDRNGKKELTDDRVSNVKVMLLNQKTGQFVKDDNGKNLVSTTNSQGRYEFLVKSGEYIVIFLYDTQMYALTDYRVDGVSEDSNSDAIEKSINIDNQEQLAGITDKIEVKNSDINNIDIGLYEKKIFDLKLDKYISKIVVQNAQGTKTYEYDKQQLAKVEIKSKYFAGSTVVVEYKIAVTNEGEVDGYVNDIIDYMPTGFKFSSELNKDWYMASDGKLHSTSLGNEKIKSGETKTVSLILTKSLSGNDGGLIANTAEIYKCSNDKSLKDIDSIPGNNANGEDDISVANIIITVSTGIVKICLIGLFIILMIIVILIYFVRRKGGRYSEKMDL